MKGSRKHILTTHWRDLQRLWCRRRWPIHIGERDIPFGTPAIEHRTSGLAPLKADVLQHPIVERLKFPARQPRMSVLAHAEPEPGDGGRKPSKPVGRER